MDELNKDRLAASGGRSPVRSLGSNSSIKNLSVNPKAGSLDDVLRPGSFSHLITMDELNKDRRAAAGGGHKDPFKDVLRSGSFSPTSRSLQMDMDDLTFAEFSRRKTDQWNRASVKRQPTDSPTMAAPTANMRNSPSSNVYSLPNVSNAIWATTSQPRNRSSLKIYTDEYSPPSGPTPKVFGQNDLSNSPRANPGSNPAGPRWSAEPWRAPSPVLPRLGVHILALTTSPLDTSYQSQPTTQLDLEAINPSYRFN